MVLTGATMAYGINDRLGGDASLQFDIHGQPDSGGTIAVKCGSATKTITVQAVTGAASIN